MQARTKTSERLSPLTEIPPFRPASTSRTPPAAAFISRSSRYDSLPSELQLLLSEQNPLFFSLISAFWAWTASPLRAKTANTRARRTTFDDKFFILKIPPEVA